MGPLDGVRVVEFDLLAPARWTGYTLATLGAEVINIEMSPAERKPKYSTPIFASDTTYRWLWYQQNKKSVILDVKKEEGVELFLRLADTADVIIEGFRPGVVERLNVDYETIAKRNPRIVYCSVTAFGQNGPYKDIFGREGNYEALAGLLDHTGPAGGPPVKRPDPTSDISAGVNACIAILAALHYRTNTGKGQYIDVAAYDSMIPLLGLRIYEHILGLKYGGDSRLNEEIRLSDSFPTKDGRLVFFQCDQPWEKFCRAVGREDLIKIDPYNRRANMSVEEQQKLRATLQQIFLSKTMDEWARLNDKEDVAVTPVLHVPEVLADPHALARKMVTEVDYAPLGRIKTLGIPFKFSESPAEVTGYPRYGENTDQVFGDLGCSKAELKKLHQLKVIE